MGLSDHNRRNTITELSIKKVKRTRALRSKNTRNIVETSAKSKFVNADNLDKIVGNGTWDTDRHELDTLRELHDNYGDSISDIFDQIDEEEVDEVPVSYVLEVKKEVIKIQKELKRLLKTADKSINIIDKVVKAA